jgi:hypothetical protein
MAKLNMTVAEYHEHNNEMNGVCLSCGEIRYGSTEPDAQNYKCDSCGKKAVQGMEIAMMADNIRIIDSSDSAEQ